MAEANFAGKTVVITGAGGGLGADMARRFGEHTPGSGIQQPTGPSCPLSPTTLANT